MPTSTLRDLLPRLRSVAQTLGKIFDRARGSLDAARDYTSACAERDAVARELAWREGGDEPVVTAVAGEAGAL
jgi:hypothetical protein